MNKAIFTPCKKKWLDMYRKGLKDMEFKGKNTKKWQVGMKVYFYESLGKKKHIKLWEKYPEYYSRRYDNGEGMMCDYITEGTGKVVMEAVIDIRYKVQINGIYETDLIINRDTNEHITLNNDDIFELENIGYDDQPYTFKLKDIKFYDEPKEMGEFTMYEEFINWCKKTIDINDKKQMSSNYWYAKTNVGGLFNVKYCPQSFCYVVEMEDE